MAKNGLADINVSNIFAKAGLGILGEAGTRLVFRSNITPDITVDISGLMRVKASEIPGATSEEGVIVPAVPDAEEVPISSQNKQLLKVIRPEVSLNVLGNQVAYAPHGRPRRSVAIAFGFALVASALIGAKIALVACKKIA